MHFQFPILFQVFHDRTNPVNNTKIHLNFGVCDVLFMSLIGLIVHV